MFQMISDDVTNNALWLGIVILKHLVKDWCWQKIFIWVDKHVTSWTNVLGASNWDHVISFLSSWMLTTVIVPLSVRLLRVVGLDLRYSADFCACVKQTFTTLDMQKATDRTLQFKTLTMFRIWFLFKIWLLSS